MGENGKVTVKIYGQEYTIAGGDSGDRVVTVARHVDKVMTELAKALPSMSVSSLAVLAAVNVTDDLYESRKHAAELEDVIADLRKDADHYIQLWEDAKSSFKQYKEDALRQEFNGEIIVEGTAKSGFVGTGAKVTVNGDVYTVVLYGDLNGDGAINPADYIIVRKALLKTVELDEIQTVAAIGPKASKVTATTYIQIRQHILGTYNFFAGEKVAQ